MKDNNLLFNIEELDNCYFICYYRDFTLPFRIKNKNNFNYFIDNIMHIYNIFEDIKDYYSLLKLVKKIEKVFNKKKFKEKELSNILIKYKLIGN